MQPTDSPGSRANQKGLQMKRAHCEMVRACSYLTVHPGAFTIGLALIFMTWLPSPAWGQWLTGSGGTIYYNGGNVGIGTTNPNTLATDEHR